MPGATITVGNVEITAVHDNEGALPLSMVFPGVDAELWVPYQQKYPEDITQALIFDKVDDGWRGQLVDVKEVEKILEFDFIN